MYRTGQSSRWTRWGIVGVIAVVTPRLAGAACNGLPQPDFGQLLPSCGSGYCYVHTPGDGSPQSLAGSFWSFGSGLTTVGQGDDNGSVPVGAWLHPSGSSLFIGGHWQLPGTDGCVVGKTAPGKPAEIMLALMTDEGSAGFYREGFFAVASSRRAATASPEFDFTFVTGGGLARDIDLVAIPRARIVGFTQPYTYRFLGPTLTDVSPGIYGDGSLAQDEVVKGYRVYRATGTVSSSRTSAGWSAITGILPLGQDVALPVPCGAPGGMSFGYTLVFDRDFETEHVGRSVHVSCTYCVDADGDGFPAIGDPDCCQDWTLCDCNDSNPNVRLDAPEVCNGVDDNCDGRIDNVAIPGSVAALQLDEQPGTTALDWAALAVATRYDVVRGDLTTLRAFLGSYADATQACVADDVTVNHADDALEPAPGSGFFYLVRAGNCTGTGSYDASDPSQVAARDAGIQASGHACH